MMNGELILSRILRNHLLVSFFAFVSLRAIEVIEFIAPLKPLDSWK